MHEAGHAAAFWLMDFRVHATSLPTIGKDGRPATVR